MDRALDDFDAAIELEPELPLPRCSIAARLFWTLIRLKGERLPTSTLLLKVHSDDTGHGRPWPGWNGNCAIIAEAIEHYREVLRQAGENSRARTTWPGCGYLSRRGPAQTQRRRSKWLSGV